MPGGRRALSTLFSSSKAVDSLLNGVGGPVPTPVKMGHVFAFEGLLGGRNEKGDGFGEPQAAGSRVPRTRILPHFCLCISSYVGLIEL